MRNSAIRVVNAHYHSKIIEARWSGSQSGRWSSPLSCRVREHEAHSRLPHLADCDTVRRATMISLC